MRRFVRKHRIALIALAVYHFVFFFPTIFMARVPSPNDVFSNFEPWASVRPAEAQNSLLNDPPTAYFTLMSLAKYDWRAFHWNPYVASGIPGWGSSAAAVLSPFILIPTFALPLAWVWTGIIFLKLNAAFFFAYLWLREERLGKRGAAVGAILFAASGPLAVRWFWQATNATTLYPALLWIALRTARGKRTPMWAVGLIALAYALAGFPATIAYGAYVAVVYFAFLVIPSVARDLSGRAARHPRHQVPRYARDDIGRVLLAVALALVIALPSLVPFIRLVRNTGYLPTRATAAAEHFFPLRHFFLFVAPDHLGNTGNRINWIGDPALGILNNYVEATVYAGLLAIPLIIVAVANRRARARWFWLAMLAVLLACMFGFMPLARMVGALPGFKYSALTRLQLVVPVAVAYLAAAGAAFVSRRRFIAIALAIIAAADLGVFAGRFYPFLEPRASVPPTTPMIAFLQAEPKPFRVAPFFDYLWPNTAEYVRVEDIRSHFSSEAQYRALLQHIDPSCTETRSTVLLFNSLKFHFDDPLVSILGVRYFIEQRSIDIVKWSIFKATVPGVKEIAAMFIAPGQSVERHVRVDAEPFWAIELPASGGIVVTLLKDGQVVYRRTFAPAETEILGKVYIPLRPYARLGESVVLRVQADKTRVRLLTGATEVAGDAPIFYGRVMTPVIFDRELPDGRLFRNLAELPRFRSSNATVALRSYAEDEQVIDVSAPASALLESSEKLTPELRVTIDGREAAPTIINTLFAAVQVPAGNHRVVFSRRVGRGWWGWSGLALGLFVIISFAEVLRRR